MAPYCLNQLKINLLHLCCTGLYGFASAVLDWNF